MRLRRGGCPGNRGGVVHFLWRFLGQGRRAWKWATVEKMGFYRTHYATTYSAEWMAVDCWADSHSGFNLSTFEAYLRSHSFTNLLWPRAGLLRSLRHTRWMSQTQCKISAALNPWVSNHAFLSPAFWRSVIKTLSGSTGRLAASLRQILSASEPRTRLETEKRAALLSTSTKANTSLTELVLCVQQLMMLYDPPPPPSPHSVLNIVPLSSVFLIHRYELMQN